MKQYISFFVLFFSHSINALELIPDWTQSGFKTPESVLFDKKRSVLFVSNMDGGGDTKDGKGFISKLNKDGSIIKMEWISGLDSPKGMAILDDSLYVTDIDRVLEISIPKAQVIQVHSVRGKFLNDVVIDDKKQVYVSDSWDDKIYRLSDGEFKPWLQHSLVKSPNGLFVEKGSLFVGVKHLLLEIDLSSKEVNILFEHNAGKVTDGVKKYRDQTFIISDWHGAIWLLEQKKQKLLRDTRKDKINAADIEYLHDEKLLIVPTFADNRILSFRLNDK